MSVAAPARVPHRPYSRIRNKPERSVTEIIGYKAIDGLPYAAANETALHAVYSTDWRELPEDQAYDRLCKHHRGVWNSRAAIGTACHEVMECWANGIAPDLYEIVCRLAEEDYTARSWRDDESAVCDRLEPYVDGLEKWWHEFSPEGGTSEDCVRTPGVYVGQRDRWGVRSKGRTWGIDLKTTAQTDSDKGVYIDSWTLQLAAYDRAEEIVTYGLDDKGRVVELSTRPNEPVDGHMIVHLRGDGEFTAYRIDVTDEAYEAFLCLARFGNWARGIARQEPKEVDL